MKVTQHKPRSIIYFQETAWVNCDRNCSKAWGISSRPCTDNDEEFLADTELGEAPCDPGHYEGSDGKPQSAREFPNKWCVRQCERSVMTELRAGPETLILPDWSRRQPT